MQNKKLVIHFDINGTITAFDSTDDEASIHQNANMLVSKNIYGTVNDGIWTINENYLEHIPDSVSYYEFLKQNKKDYKEMSYVFTEPNNPGELIHHYVDLVVKSLEDILFKSFLKVLDAYPDATIVLRSFGGDIPLILQTLDNHPKFQQVKIGHSVYDEQGNFSVVFEDGTSFDDSMSSKRSTTNSLSELHDLFFTTSCSIAIRDDYKQWNKTKQTPEKMLGKLVGSDDRLIQIFFDDNNRVSHHQADPDKTKFVKINGLMALTNDDFYIDHIKEFLKN